MPQHNNVGKSDTEHHRFKDLEIEIEETKTRKKRKIIIGTEDFVAIGCVLLALGILLGVIFTRIDAKLGIPAIATFVSGTIVVQIIKAKRKGS